MIFQVVHEERPASRGVDLLHQSESNDLSIGYSRANRIVSVLSVRRPSVIGMRSCFQPRKIGNFNAMPAPQTLSSKGVRPPSWN